MKRRRERPMATPFDDQSQTTSNQINTSAANSTALNTPTTGYQSLLMSSRSVRPSLSVTVRESTPGLSGLSQRVDMSWRDTQLQVSFRYFTSAEVRAINVPLVRCTDVEHRAIDEDTKVVASWLSYDSLRQLLQEHLDRHDPDGLCKLDGEAILCASLRTRQMIKIEDSNDFHTAFNDWLRDPIGSTQHFHLTVTPKTAFVEIPDLDAQDVTDPSIPDPDVELKPAEESSASPSLKRARMNTNLDAVSDNGEFTTKPDLPNQPVKGALSSKSDLPMNEPTATYKEEEDDDHDALGPGQTYTRLMDTQNAIPFRPGDEEHFTNWNKHKKTTPAVGNPNKSRYDYDRRNHVRPPRFEDPTWLSNARIGVRHDDIPSPRHSDATEDDDPAELANQVLNNVALEQFHPEMWSTIATYLMVKEDVRFKQTYRFQIPGANPTCARSPAQVFGGLWLKLNARKVMGGMLADQVGSGKTRTMLAHAVFDRAYINRMWQDWIADDQESKNNSQHKRRHLPRVKDQQGTPRCPSARKWLCQCVCESWGVTAKFEEKRGPTVVFVPRGIMVPWIDEFRKMCEKDPNNPNDRYKNTGFGKRHGFGSDDNRPFRLIVAHNETITGYPDHDIQESDRDLLSGHHSTVKHDTSSGSKAHIQYEPKLAADRVIVLTTLDSYQSYLLPRIQWQQKVSTKVRGKDQHKMASYPEWTRWGAVIVDEAHRNRSTPPVIKKLIQPIEGDSLTWVTPQPYLWLLSGTPFAVDVFRDFGVPWAPLFEELCERDPKRISWTDPGSWMEGFDEAKIQELVRHAKELTRESERQTQNTRRQLKEEYVKKAAKFASRMIIQRTEDTRIQGQPTTKLPPVTRAEYLVQLNDSQIELSNEPWVTVRKNAQNDWRQATARWKRDRRGPPPKLETYLDQSARNLPLVRAATSFAELVNVAISWPRQNELPPLKLTIEEIHRHKWDSSSNEKAGPYHECMEQIMANCSKKNVLDQFWDTVARSKNRENKFDKAIVFTCSPAAALVVYQYYKYGCNRKSSKFYRRQRPMRCLLITSQNMSQTDKNAWVSVFNESFVDENNKFKQEKSPDILVVTTGTFGTGQNCGRARYALILEPQPQVQLSIQCAGRIRRSGYDEPVFVWDVSTTNSDWERLQKARNQGHTELLELIKRYEREAEANQTMRID